MYDNDALSIFGSKLVHLAKQSLEPKQVVDLNKLIDSAYSAIKAQNMPEFNKLEDKITSVLKKTDVSPEMVKEYFEVLRGLDNQKAVSKMMPNISEYLKKNASEVEIPTSPVDIIDEAVKL